jgi:hypothetical protein
MIKIKCDTYCKLEILARPKLEVSTRKLIHRLLIMSSPCNPHHLEQVNEEERQGFESWRETNLELIQLRVQLKSITNNGPQHLILFSQIKLLKLKKNQYTNPSTSTSPKHLPVPVMNTSLSIQQPSMGSSPKKALSKHMILLSQNLLSQNLIITTLCLI